MALEKINNGDSGAVAAQKILDNDSYILAQIDFAVPKVPMVTGAAYDEAGNLLNTGGFSHSEKYVTKPGDVFKNGFTGVGFAVRAVFWDADNMVVGFSPTGSSADIVIPANTKFVAFNNSSGIEGVTPPAVFWAMQEDEKINVDFNTKLSQVNTLIEAQENQLNEINKQLDEIIDGGAPYFIDIGNFMKTYGGLTNPSHTLIYDVTRVNDYDISGDFSAFNIMFMGVTILTSDGNHIFRCVKKISNTLLRSWEILPAAFTQMQSTIGDAQHLSRYGYKGLGEYIAEAIPRKRKTKFISALSQNCEPHSKDWVQGGKTLLSVTRLPNTAVGGFVAPGVTGGCGMGENDSTPHTGNLFKNSYNINQNTAGTGITTTVNVGGFSGFGQINLGERDNNETAVTVIVAADNGDIIFQEDIRDVNRWVYFNFDKSVKALTITIKSAADGLFTWLVNAIEIFKDYNTYDAIFKRNHRAVWVLDSWGVFSTAISGETAFTNPMGVQQNGLGNTPKRYAEHLTAQGFTVACPNYSRGGMTVKWADWFIDKFLDNEPVTPDYVFLDFCINDTNSRGIVGDSPYDFDPIDPYSAKLQSAGGVKGSISLEEHIAFYKSLIRKIISRGSKPVLLINVQSGQQFGYIDTLVAQLNADFNVK